MPGKIIDRELVCALTDQEVLSRAAMLGETVAQIDSVQSVRSESMRAFKEQLTGLAEVQRKLSRAIFDRTEKRMVTCRVEWHTPQEGFKRVIRLDTGEVIGEEPMTDSEKQMNLFAAQQEFEKFMREAGADCKSDAAGETGAEEDASA